VTVSPDDPVQRSYATGVSGQVTLPQATARSRW
jgi:hypothetical protein